MQRLHALDIATGAEKFGGPVVIQASVPGTGSGIARRARCRSTRCARTSGPRCSCYNGVVYFGFASHGDIQPYHGWVLGYNATTLQRVLAFCQHAERRRRRHLA